MGVVSAILVAVVIAWLWAANIHPADVWLRQAKAAYDGKRYEQAYTALLHVEKYGAQRWPEWAEQAVIPVLLNACDRQDLETVQAILALLARHTENPLAIQILQEFWQEEMVLHQIEVLLRQGEYEEVRQLCEQATAASLKHFESKAERKIWLTTIKLAD